MEYQGDRLDEGAFKGRYTAPTVLYFQPKEFMVLKDPASLRRWEADLANKVGLKGLGKNYADDVIKNGGTCCESGSSNDCDQD